tara:strand:- start:1279 stop:1512 length:234 start_codon:yes stop_codon:yes gene_type:complete
MKIYEVVDELTERGKGADGAYELQKRKTDPMSPQNISKNPQSSAGQKSYHNYMQRGSTMRRMGMTSKQYGKGNVGLT